MSTKPHPPPRAGRKPLSLLAQFDELVRHGTVLSAGQEEEMIAILRQNEKARKIWLSVTEDHTRCETLVKKLGSERTALETQLKHARNQIHIEMERRLNAEKARDSLDRQIGLIREMLVDKKNNSIVTDFNRELLAPVLTSKGQNGAGSAQPGAGWNQSADAGLHMGQGGAPPSRTTPKRALDTINESSNSILDDDISYDKTEEEDAFNSALTGDASFNVTNRRSGGRRRSSKGRRSGKRPSAPLLDVIENDHPAPAKKQTPSNFEQATAPPMDERPPQSGRQNINARDDDRHSVDSFWDVGGGGGGGCVGTRPSELLTPGPKNVTNRTPASLRKTPSSVLSPCLTPSTTGRGGLARPHAFVQKTIVKMEPCNPCGKRITFGKIAYKCRDCRSICHPECRDLVPLPCISASQNATPRGAVIQGTLADYAPMDAPMIPALIIHCAKEVEARGMKEQGIYRVPGADPMVKDLLEKFQRGKGVPNLARVEDIHVVCSCLKHFLRKLKEPVTTYGLWGSFVRAAEIYRSGEVEHAVAMAKDTVSQLPQPNRDTLAFLLLHLTRVSKSPATKMPVYNLAKVFGPTIVGYSSAEPEALQMLNEPKKQADVLELLLSGVELSFWEDIMSPADENADPVTPDLTIRLGNRLGTIATPEGDAGMAPSGSLRPAGPGSTAGSLNRLFARNNKIGSNRKPKVSNNFHASPQLK